MNARTAIVMPWLRAGFDVLLCADEGRVRELRGRAESGGAPSIGGGPGQPVSEQAQAGAPAPAFRRPPGAAPSGAFSAPAEAGNRSGGPRQAPRGTGSGFREYGAPAPSAGERPAGRGVRQPVPAVSVPAADAGEKRRPQSAPSPRRGETAASGALAFEQWPEAWRALKTRRPMPEHPLVMWTYGGLGEDLTGTPDADRREVIVRMLRMLGHPGGTHVFWPYSLPGIPPSEEGSLFWSGVRLFAPRVILLFGSDARDALGMPRTLLPFSQERVDGRLIIQLPRPQAFVGDEAAFARAQVFLGRLLQFCSRRPV